MNIQNRQPSVMDFRCWQKGFMIHCVMEIILIHYANFINRPSYAFHTKPNRFRITLAGL